MSWTRRFCRLRPPATPLPVTLRSCRSFYSTVPGKTQPQPKPSTPAPARRSVPSAAAPYQQSLGSLAKTSIWEQDEEERQQAELELLADNFGGPSEQPLRYPIADRNPATMAAALDPRPRARIRFERRRVIKETRKRGRLTKELLLKRTERQYVQQSETHKVGMKKVMLLARQIAGKTIEDAILQMRFSKKKAATWIHDHLVASRDRAIVERGMGLGWAKAEEAKRMAKSVAKAESNEGFKVEVDAKAKDLEPIKIELKDGTRHKIKDRTGIYIDQAWVGKGIYGRAQKKRAKKRIDLLRLPQTTLTVLLKEEKTRIREWEERRAKEDRKKVWMQLPNRPITGPQRAYYSW